jgi:hypothetical protein
MAHLKKRARFPFDLIRTSLPTFYDMWLMLKTRVTKENPIGIYVGICNKSEVNMFFEDCVAGGYTGWVLIKIFAHPECGDYAECAEEILNHEVLHQVLERIEGHEAKMALDNIHRSFYCYDEATKKWRFVVEFAAEDKLKKTIKIL